MATDVLKLLQVPPVVVLDNDVFVPIQMLLRPDIEAGAAGTVFTVTPVVTEVDPQALDTV